MTPELMTELTKGIVSVVLILITAFVIPWLKNMVGENKYETIVEYAEIVVRSAEKLYTPEEWSVKKSYAVHMLNKKAEALGLNISEQEINAIVEGAVQAVKG